MKISPGSRKVGSVIFPFLVIAAVLLGRQWYFTPNASAGDHAIDFTATTLAGKSFSLKDARGQIVLLHFWGSWCGPCRRQNPELVKLARELGDELRIVSIGIEQKKERWQAAIQRDGLFWPDQIMDTSSSLKFLNGPISDLYGVNQVPMEFLLDKEGKVIATNPDFTTIRQYVNDAR